MEFFENCYRPLEPFSHAQDATFGSTLEITHGHTVNLPGTLFNFSFGTDKKLSTPDRNSQLIENKSVGNRLLDLDIETCGFGIEAQEKFGHMGVFLTSFQASHSGTPWSHHLGGYAPNLEAASGFEPEWRALQAPA